MCRATMLQAALCGYAPLSGLADDGARVPPTSRQSVKEADHTTAPVRCTGSLTSYVSQLATPSLLVERTRVLAGSGLTQF